MGEAAGIDLDDKLINPVASLAMEAHKFPGEPFRRKKLNGSSAVVFAFSGSWAPDDRVDAQAQAPFGEVKIDPVVFPSLRSLGDGGVAAVNGWFLRRFDGIKSSLIQKVRKVMADKKKQVVFAGHSSGGAVAVLATVYFLENRKPDHHKPPLCYTFGSPLVGDRIFGHALRREKWSECFVHFVMRYDVIPRIMLSPPSDKHREVLRYIKVKSESSRNAIAPPSGFYPTVMTAASSVASYDACNLMGFKALETLRKFIDVSPYRPFGTYIFLPENGKLVVVRNPDAVLQILFYSAQLRQEDQAAEVERRSLDQHFAYENELKKGLKTQGVDYSITKELEELRLSSDDNRPGDLGLCPEANLRLRIAAEAEKRRSRNKDRIMNDYKKKIDEELKKLEEYKEKAETGGRGCYDSFKRHEKEEDFKANVRRLKLAGIWDDIKEMLKGYELPDEFERSQEIIDLGTRYRRLVEPLDIANFYRHSKDEETGRYMKDGTRPKRYRFIQSWLEHHEKKLPGSRLESCFWAEVEYLRIKTRKDEEFSQETKQEVQQLENNLLAWVDEEVVTRKEVFFWDSTFAKWWRDELFPEYKPSTRIDKQIFLRNQSPAL